MVNADFPPQKLTTVNCHSEHRLQPLLAERHSDESYHENDRTILQGSFSVINKSLSGRCEPGRSAIHPTSGLRTFSRSQRSPCQFLRRNAANGLTCTANRALPRIPCENDCRTRHCKARAFFPVHLSRGNSASRLCRFQYSGGPEKLVLARETVAISYQCQNRLWQ